MYTIETLEDGRVQLNILDSSQDVIWLRFIFNSQEELNTFLGNKLLD